MRVTQNSSFIPFQSSLEDIQLKISKEQARLGSGKQILSISDSPSELVKAKRYTEMIDTNTQYQSNVSSALDELQSVSDTLDSMQNSFQTIRDYAISANQVGFNGNLGTLATTIKGLLQDIVKQANSDYNGKFLFSGTLTTKDSITPTGAQTDNNPFELIQTAPSATNPSGLEIAFKGNNSDSEIQKEAGSTESINVKANDIFGTSGTQVFQSIINLYNLLAYKSDGTPRPDNSTFTTEESSKLNNAQKNISDILTQIQGVNSLVGAKINRFTAVNDQLTSENTRLKEFRSKIEDTDVAQSAITLAREQNTLQYTLQVGSKLVQQTLFDFLS